MTRVIEELNLAGIFPQRWTAEDDFKTIQQKIDEVTPSLLEKLSDQDIINHNISAYNDSTQAYATKPINQKVIPDLPVFMNHLQQDNYVLDLGCAFGRDTKYMTDTNHRREVHKEDSMVAPEHTLKVVPFEGSAEFLYHLLEECSAETIVNIPLAVQGDFARPGYGKEIFSEKTIKSFLLREALTRGNPLPVLDGIWACASLLIHLPEKKLDSVVAGWSHLLKHKGVFSASYILPRNEGPVKFLASRSAPGEIKIFTQYTKKRIDKAFAAAGLKPVDFSKGDYTGHGYTQTDFFGSGLYKKNF